MVCHFDGWPSEVGDPTGVCATAPALNINPTTLPTTAKDPQRRIVASPFVPAILAELVRAVRQSRNRYAIGPRLAARHDDVMMAQPVVLASRRA
jgi:hypothetical protein